MCDLCEIQDKKIIFEFDTLNTKDNVKCYLDNRYKTIPFLKVEVNSKANGTSSHGIEIKFCPKCGKKL